MKTHLYGLFGLLCLLLSTGAFSSEMTTSTLNATSILPQGNYTTTGWSHYLDKTIKLEHWADQLVMSAVLMRDGRLYEVKAWLEPNYDNTYEGSGKIIVRYGGGYGCVHKFAAKIFPYGDHFFLRENTPRYIPYNPHGPCTAAKKYIWFNHEQPYYLK